MKLGARGALGRAPEHGCHSHAAAPVAMPGLSDRVEAEAVALRCDDPSLPRGWEAAL